MFFQNDVKNKDKKALIVVSLLKSWSKNRGSDFF